MGDDGVMTMKPSLREELSVPQTPDFEIELPAGWSRREVSPETLAELTAATKQTFMRAHQPQMQGVMGRLLREAFEGMNRAGAFAIWAPFGAAESSPTMMTSLLARVRRAPPGKSLDAHARELIRSKGATPLRGDKRMLRYAEDENVRLESETFVNHSISYLTPVPGAQRRRALELVASVVRPVAVPAESPWFVSRISLMDLCVASFRWSRVPTAQS